MWVIKLGGSWLSNPELKNLIKLLQCRSKNITTLVVGGGLFADSVRKAQTHLHFDESLAHNLALKATEFYANIIANICDNVELISNLDNLSKNKNLKIWTPYRYLKQKNFLEKNWNSTSDSISCWLADHIGAVGLILIKSLEIKEKKINLRNLETRGVIDKNFKKHTNHSLKFKIVGPELINILQSKQSWNNIVKNLCEIEL